MGYEKIKIHFMKTMTLNQMGEINGSFDCSTRSQLSFVGGSVLAGTLIAGPWGYLGGLVFSSAVMIWKCPGTNH